MYYYKQNNYHQRQNLVLSDVDATVVGAGNERGATVPRPMLPGWRVSVTVRVRDGLGSGSGSGPG